MLEKIKNYQLKNKNIHLAKVNLDNVYKIAQLKIIIHIYL